MNPVLLIAKKRDGGELTAEEITWFIKGFTSGAIPDYQMSAWAMAVYWRGMTTEETAALTHAMLHSGETLPWSPAAPPRVDKHSTGGIGDKTSLILAPLLACCGLWVPMLSGRGLGATGGTLDKLEAIAGFRTDLDSDEIRRVVERVGCVITGASSNLAPADKKLYALRDVTATVASIPLITASIMSKKLAEGLDALVLDVKFGSGAFMKTRQLARELAHALVATGRRMGVKTTALLTDMNQPLGKMAGNAVEVEESLACLRGEGPADLREVTLELGVELLLSAGRESDYQAAHATLAQQLDSGAALEKFAEMVAAQGGDLRAPRHVAQELLIHASQAGYVSHIDTEALGIAIIELGGGRRKLTDLINHSVVLEMLVRVGDAVEAEQPLLRLFADLDDGQRVAPLVQQAIKISEEVWSPLTLVVERIGD